MLLSIIMCIYIYIYTYLRAGGGQFFVYVGLVWSTMLFVKFVSSSCLLCIFFCFFYEQGLARRPPGGFCRNWSQKQAWARQLSCSWGFQPERYYMLINDAYNGRVPESLFWGWIVSSVGGTEMSLDIAIKALRCPWLASSGQEGRLGWLLLLLSENDGLKPRPSNRPLGRRPAISMMVISFAFNMLHCCLHVLFCIKDLSILLYTRYKSQLQLRVELMNNDTVKTWRRQGPGNSPSETRIANNNCELEWLDNDEEHAVCRCTGRAQSSTISLVSLVFVVRPRVWGLLVRLLERNWNALEGRWVPQPPHHWAWQGQGPWHDLCDAVWWGTKHCKKMRRLMWYMVFCS